MGLMFSFPFNGVSSKIEKVSSIGVTCLFDETGFVLCTIKFQPDV